MTLHTKYIIKLVWFSHSNHLKKNLLFYIFQWTNSSNSYVQSSHNTVNVMAINIKFPKEAHHQQWWLISLFVSGSKVSKHHPYWQVTWDVERDRGDISGITTFFICVNWLQVCLLTFFSGLVTKRDIIYLIFSF
jgi:hypothetical protein